MIDRKSGTITIPQPTLVQKAFAIYFIWLHEVQFELAENHHPSWNGYTKKSFSKIIKLKAKMTDDERNELAEKIKPYKI